MSSSFISFRLLDHFLIVFSRFGCLVPVGPVISFLPLSVLKRTRRFGNKKAAGSIFIAGVFYLRGFSILKAPGLSVEAQQARVQAFDGKILFA